MSKLMDLAHQCAVTINKSENMRVTCGKWVVEARQYMSTDQGVLDCVEAGIDPTDRGFYTLVVADPMYPQSLKSFSSYRRLVRIGRAEDPEAQAIKENERSGLCKESVPDRDTNVTEAPSHAPVDLSTLVLQAKVDPVENTYTYVESTLTEDQFVELTKRMVKRCNEIAAERKQRAPAWRADIAIARPGTEEFQIERSAFYLARRKQQEEQGF